jgi:hypothetical protein
MALKGWLKRLEQAARGDLANFMLEDGSRHYFDPKSGELFLHGCACLRAQHAGVPFPEPPETIKALRRARDRGAALEQVAGGEASGTLGIFPYDPEALVERGVLVPRSLVAGRELGAPVEDLSE